MERISITLAALCALFLSLVAVNDTLGQNVITNEVIYHWFDDNRPANEYTPPAGWDDFEGEEWANGNIIFPPPNMWAGFPWSWNDLDDGTYTLNLPAGRSFTFTGGLIIQETEYVVEETVGIGRIQALGGPGNMVTMDAEDETWGGIRVETAPDGDNTIDYCLIQNVAGQDNHCIWVVANAVPAQASITHNLIQNSDGDVDGIRVTRLGVGDPPVWGEPLVVIQNNRITNCFRGIHFNGAAQVEDPVVLLDDIAYNHIDGNRERGMDIHVEVEGSIRNNLLYDNAEEQIWVELTLANDGAVVNNTIDGNSGEGAHGIWFEGGWSPVVNNIILNCDIPVGIQPMGNNQFDYCLLFNNEQAPLHCQAGGNCIEDDPEIVEPTFYPPSKNQLFWTSPAINHGDPAVELNDPDGSRNDMGTYGGPGAGSLELYTGGYSDYCLINDEEWEDPVALQRDSYRVIQDLTVTEDLTIEDGTRLTFVGTGLEISAGSAVIGDLEGDAVVFQPLTPTQSWDGISVSTPEAVELYNCEIIYAGNVNDAALTMAGPIKCYR